MTSIAFEIAEFITENYPIITDTVAVADFISRTDYLHIERKDGKIILLAIYFMVNAETLRRISSDSKYHEDAQFLVDCMRQRGDNAHVYIVIHKGDFSFLRRSFRAAIISHKPATVSWYNQDMSRFHIKNVRRNIWHQQ